MFWILLQYSMKAEGNKLYKIIKCGVLKIWTGNCEKNGKVHTVTYDNMNVPFCVQYHFWSNCHLDMSRNISHVNIKVASFSKNWVQNMWNKDPNIVAEFGRVWGVKCWHGYLKYISEFVTHIHMKCVDLQESYLSLIF